MVFSAVFCKFSISQNLVETPLEVIEVREKSDFFEPNLQLSFLRNICIELFFLCY